MTNDEVDINKDIAMARACRVTHVSTTVSELLLSLTYDRRWYYVVCLRTLRQVRALMHGKIGTLRLRARLQT